MKFKQYRNKMENKPVLDGDLLMDENWWKDPRLDDEGTYDYLIEELPKDTSKWERYYQKCESCGKYHRLNKVDTHYFYCYDGWDSISYTECWKCRLKATVHGIISKAKKKLDPKWKERREYRDMVKSIKKKGRKLTKTEKTLIWKIVSHNT